MGHNSVVPLTARKHEEGAFAVPLEGALENDEAAHDEAWPRNAANSWRAAKWLAGGILAAWLVGWPIGSTMGATAALGRFAFRLGYTIEVLLFALTTAALVLAGGRALAAGFRLEDSAERLRRAANSFAGTLGPNGTAARAEIGALNAEIDRALERLASAESMIRQQVRALDSAGAAIESGTAKSAERLEAERSALMNLTEEMNKEAEAFAEKIAERSRTASEAGSATEARLRETNETLDGQIERLEEISRRSLERFETLADSMAGRSEALAAQAEQQSEATAKLGENQSALLQAQSDLADHAKRIETLMKDQRQRAEKLAKAVADQTARLTRLGETAPKPKRRGAWRDILSAVERGLPARSESPAPADVKAAMDRLVERMHRFSLTMRTSLYGGPARDDLARFEGGERLIFVRELLEEDSSELRRRIATEAGRNAVFDSAVREFLGDFDALLQPLGAEGEGDEAIAETLKSPLGRLYVLVGTALGRFD
ncbi:hypothetical protein [Parvularcula dongshanensis]|uniref:Archaellum component FlaC n=1 Tax=Parvularcula dongshanensis TaxID=1173995 RepID=A0A840I0G0_9PROT|nr:hypothetical protein [Parvularcula dongshanensis]MBB4657763.1 archaellum component FlaC [Parvularcula dongshanensis]